MNNYNSKIEIKTSTVSSFANEIKIKNQPSQKKNNRKLVLIDNPENDIQSDSKTKNLHSKKRVQSSIKTINYHHHQHSVLSLIFI